MMISLTGPSSAGWVVRFFLLAGLIAHKAIWEVLRGRSVGRRAKQGAATIQGVKIVKLAILLGIVAQTLSPLDILPITSHPSGLRIVGAIFFTIGLLVAVLGRLQLGHNWSDIESPLVDRDQVVVASGVYAYVRHPIYAGDLALLLGLELCLNSWLVLAIVLLAPVVLRKAVLEERMLAQRLPGYDMYVARTKRFIPFIV
jgi:protein-S-isoprenylcysteine O-methyltransferase Ste14